MKKERVNDVLNRITDDTCTGCGACKNICPVEAIYMGQNSEGFLFPKIKREICVNCGLCAQICPVINFETGANEISPVPNAVRCDDEIRRKSSSGGVFSLLANYILSKQGFVCGAEYDNDMQLHHVIADEGYGIDKMRGSKYIQSNTEMVYREVKSKLEENQYVLFTGCPCQVAALYRFLGVNYEKLYTVDLLCHGVPSQHIFNRYISEIANGRKVKGVRFRDKRYGWISTKIVVEFENGDVYEGDWREDSYEKGFQHNIFLRKSCENCQYSEFPRRGDITIGDFWQVEKFDKSQNDGKGTSLLFFNNEKGRNLFQCARDNKTVMKEVEIAIDNIPNRFKAYYPKHPARERFFELISTRSVRESIASVMQKKFDVGLVGIYTVENFGGAITYFALYKAITKLGYSCLMIERPMNAPHKPSDMSVYEFPPYKSYERAPIYPNKESMHELNGNCDKFIVGSDQMFNDYLYNNFGRWCTLDWVKDSKIKLAYAASFGHDYIWSPEDTRTQMAYFMQKFDRFSVREKSGVKIAKENFGVDATWVLDPVFLCDADEYIKLAECVNPDIKEPYVGAYILDPTKEKQDLLISLGARFQVDVNVYSEMKYKNLDNGWDLPVKTGKVEHYLNSIIHSDFFVADSFHGICFAIIFNKNFIAFNNGRRGKSRLESILTLLGLENRLLDNPSDFSNELLQPIDYEKVNYKLNVERQRCLGWLKEALSLSDKKPASSYDILNQYIRNLEHKVLVLSEENRQISSRWAASFNNYDWEYAQIEGIEQYFDKLEDNKQNLVIAIAIKDTPGYAFNKILAEKMMKLGFDTDLCNKHWYAYAGILYKSKKEESLDEGGQAYLTKVIGRKMIEVVSQSYHNGNLASIKVNRKEYAVNQRGLNIVVLSRNRLQVLDSVCFDTHAPRFLCYRN